MRKAVVFAAVLLLACNPASFGKKKKGGGAPDAVPGGDTSIVLTPLPVTVMQPHGLSLETNQASEDARTSHSASQGLVGWNLHFKETDKTSRSMSIGYTVSNSVPQQQATTLQWFFIGARADTGQMLIFDRGQKAITIDPSGHIDDTVTSANVASADVSHNGRVTNSGQRIVGWILRLVDPNGAVISQQTSDSDTEDLTRDVDKVQQLNAGTLHP